VRNVSAKLLSFAAAGLVCACGFDDSLREYLNARFWLPFAKHSQDFEKPGVRRIDRPFAGMTATTADTPLARLRSAYQRIAHPDMADNPPGFDLEALHEAVTAARADGSLSPRDKEEVELIDAKIDLRAADPGDKAALGAVQTKVQAFLKSARTPEFLSEARGWLARVYYLRGEQAAAGKLYLDELNRGGSNLSRETLLNSLRLTYGYDGGPRLLDHLEEYFDTPEHAAFAIQLATNPHWERHSQHFKEDSDAATYSRIRALLQKHSSLLRSEALTLLSMRTALRMGDPEGARAIAEKAPDNAVFRSEPEFLWMTASSAFLTHDYSAAYGLCGAYRKTGNAVEQLRYALWLHTTGRAKQVYQINTGLADFSVYWAVSGWDLGLLLDAEAPDAALQSFIEQNPNIADLRLVKYALAVRLARENRYDESARIFEEIHAVRRAPRMRKLAALYQEASKSPEAKYSFAEFLADNENGIYFNDTLWGGSQSYVFRGSEDDRLTGSEREEQIALERKLKDDQEEYWRAYLILRDVVRDSGDPALSRRAAQLGIRCLRRMSARFGRLDELRAADRELWSWLQKQR
jgi:hypothetical protein